MGRVKLHAATSTMSTEAGPSAQVQQDHGMQEDELLHDEDLLDLDEDFEEGLRELGLLHEFATGVIDSAAHHPAGEQAVAAAAELAVALGATDKPLSRQQLAEESYRDKVSARPPNTSRAYKSAQKGFQARTNVTKEIGLVALQSVTFEEGYCAGLVRQNRKLQHSV